jgi:hypothetical protein
MVVKPGLESVVPQATLVAGRSTRFLEGRRCEEGYTKIIVWLQSLLVLGQAVVYGRVYIIEAILGKPFFAEISASLHVLRCYLHRYVYLVIPMQPWLWFKVAATL